MSDPATPAELQTPDTPAESAQPTEPQAAAAPAPPEAPAPAPPQFYQPGPMDLFQMLAQQNQQLAQQNQMIAGQVNQIGNYLKPAEKEEELPDPTLEPDKYVNRVVEKKVQQFQPMLQQMQLQNAVNTALLTREQVSKEIGPEWTKYEGMVNQLAGQFAPDAFTNPAAWKALYFMAKGAESSAPAPATASASPQQTGPAAPQGQWPGARQAPPPVAAPGSGSPAPSGYKLTDEQKQMARRYGMTEEEYAKYAEEA